MGFSGSEGHTLHYKLLAPPGIHPRTYKPTKPFPLVLHVYGGPHVQMCITGARWGDQFFYLQYLVQQGFMVLSVDNRGSSGRGAEFEKTVYKRMGEPELWDQLQGIEKLFLARSSPYFGLVDPNRIGIYGHSYGGYMTLMCTLRCWRNVLTGECGLWTDSDNPSSANVYSPRRPLFRAAVAGAPVSDWKLYDTHYTERYMGIPFTLEEGEKSVVSTSNSGTSGGSPGASTDPSTVSKIAQSHPSFLNLDPENNTPENASSGYRKSSVTPYVKFYDDNLSKLLIYHGMADDNVLFQNSTQVYKELINQGKVFQCVDYPGSKHSMSGVKVKTHLYKTITSFLEAQLTE